MKIYCRNYKCKWIRFLNTPIKFHFRKGHYIPFEDDTCRGECRKEDILINSIDFIDKNTSKRIAYCTDAEIEKENGK